MKFIKHILTSALGSVIGIVVGGTILIFIFVSMFFGGLMTMFSDLEAGNIDAYDGEANVLVVNLNAAIVERGVEPFTFNIFDMSASPQIGLDQILDGLKRASEDDKIKGILLQVDGVTAGPSTLEDIRRGLEDFKNSGKWIVAWSETMSQTGYFMSSVADEVYLHPNGGMELLGLRSLTMFYPGLLEKLGIDVTVLRGPNNKYKSAVEPIIRSDFSEANKVQLNALLADIWDMIRTGISDSRGMTPQKVDDIAENILLRLPSDALELGLVDDLFYEDERDAL
jgi:protease-4